MTTKSPARRLVWVAYDANNTPRGEGYTSGQAMEDACVRRMRRTGERRDKVVAWARGLVCRVPAEEPPTDHPLLPGLEIPSALVVVTPAPTLLPPAPHQGRSVQIPLFSSAPPAAAVVCPRCGAGVEGLGRPGGQPRLCTLHRRVRYGVPRRHSELGLIWALHRHAGDPPEVVRVRGRDLLPEGVVVHLIPRETWFQLKVAQ